MATKTIELCIVYYYITEAVTQVLLPVVCTRILYTTASACKSGQEDFSLLKIATHFVQNTLTMRMKCFQHHDIA